MSRGYGFRPKFDITVGVRDIESDYAQAVGNILGEALAKIQLLAKHQGLPNPEALTTDLEVTPQSVTADDYKQVAFAKAFTKAGGNIKKAAKALKVSERSIYRWITEKGKGVIEGENT
jgi:transcriptional regulator with PAS, ATPase and Fis domain